jgi:hypothetical protein
MPTPEEVKAAPGGVYGPIDFGGRMAMVGWISNHYDGDQELDLMLEWFQVSDDAQIYGRIAVNREGLVFTFAPADPSPDGRPANSMDEAIRDLRPN